MPAASEARPGQPVPLPHTWRPFGVRVAATALGMVLIVVCTVAWFGFPQEVRDQFTPFQRGTVVFLGLLLTAVWWALVRCRLDATEGGLTVVNGFRRRELDWPQVLAVHLPPGAPWAVLDLADGTACPVMGIQGSDGTRARRAVRELRTLLDRRAGGHA